MINRDEKFPCKCFAICNHYYIRAVTIAGFVKGYQDPDTLMDVHGQAYLAKNAFLKREDAMIYANHLIDERQSLLYKWRENTNKLLD